MCWDNARTLAHDTGNPKITAVDRIAEVRHQQLFFANMAALAAPGGSGTRRSRVAEQRGPRMPAAPRKKTGQLMRLEKPAHAPGIVATARQTLRRISEAHGWTKSAYYKTRKGLDLALADYTAGGRITYSQLLTRLPEHRISVTRTAEVLQELGVCHDDRPPSFEASLATRLVGLAPGITAEVEQWVHALATGTDRRTARSVKTVLRYLDAARPALRSWSGRHGHLREVVRDDVLATLEPLAGNERSTTLVALRSLFGTAMKMGVIFRNPTGRIRVGSRTHGVLQPLADDQVRQAVIAAVRPADPLIVALATIHAARTRAIQQMLLDDVDLGNRRIIVAGRAHPLDELTRRALLHWLNHRRAAWPATVNPYLLVNHRTAVHHGNVSNTWLTTALRGLDATVERLHLDRHLDEALTNRADPLHLAVVFGLSPKAALRYANTAKQLLVTSITTERQTRR